MKNQEQMKDVSLRDHICEKLGVEAGELYDKMSPWQLAISFASKAGDKFFIRPKKPMSEEDLCEIIREYYENLGLSVEVDNSDPSDGPQVDARNENGVHLRTMTSFVRDSVVFSCYDCSL